MKLNVLAVGLSLGIVYAACMFLLGIAAMLGWGQAVADLTADLYVGFGPTWVGSIIGAAYGFIDGFIGGSVFAWLYNKMQ